MANSSKLSQIQNLLFGRPLATSEERAEHIGPIAGIPIFGLDALSSAAYGPEAALTLLIRTGRSPEYKRELLTRLWRLLQDATGAPDDQIVLGIQEVPPSQAMEMGQIMPDVAAH